MSKEEWGNLVKYTKDKSKGFKESCQNKTTRVEDWKEYLGLDKVPNKLPIHPMLYYAQCEKPKPVVGRFIGSGESQKIYKVAVDGFLCRISHFELLPEVQKEFRFTRAGPEPFTNERQHKEYEFWVLNAFHDSKKNPIITLSMFSPVNTRKNNPMMNPWNRDLSMNSSKFETNNALTNEILSLFRR